MPARPAGAFTLSSAMIGVMPATRRPSRRAVLRGAGLGVVAALSVGGCSGDRLRTPWSPEPGEDERASSPPDADQLLAAHARLVRYRSMLGAMATDSSSERDRADLFGELWASQQERVDGLLTLADVALPSATADDASVTTGASTAAPVQALDLGRVIREDLGTAVEQVTSASATHRAMLLSLTAQHAVSAARLGAEVSWPELVGPAGAAAVPVLAVTRPAAFGLEVVAARSSGDERERYEDVLGPVRSVNRSLTTLAGDAAPVPPLGYDLPEPLEDRQQRSGLARALVADIAPAVLSVADRAGSPEQTESLVRLVAEGTAWGRRLGIDDTPFPGMVLP